MKIIRTEQILSPKAPLQQQKQWKRIFCTLFYNLINMGLMLCIFPVTVIRSDGPSGFGEMVLGNFFMLLSIAFFCIGMIISDIEYRAIKPRFLLRFVCSLMTIFLACFAVLGIITACSDEKGHCRKWDIYLADCPSHQHHRLSFTQNNR
ncbi:MAG TPA: hypothetical protein DEB25_09125 [Desulfobulbaceae bacterium]|nr:hypothetical protein [Desulfobulbaceae bacterium]